MPYVPDGREGLLSAAALLGDDDLAVLATALAEEVKRRRSIAAGLDVGESIQFNVVVTMIKERVLGIKDEDVLRMIRAHVPEPS